MQKAERDAGLKACNSARKSKFDKESAKLRIYAALDPTCGLRCLACVGVLTFHVAWYLGLAAEDRHEIDDALTDHKWFTFIYNPEPPMQAFLCLTGFLTTISLIPALEKTKSYWQMLGRYYKKRFLRIVPAYYAMLLFIRTVLVPLGESERFWRGKPESLRQAWFGAMGTFDLGYCKTSMLHNIFFVHNQLPAGGCYMTTWSLAVQMQFWCIFPLVLLALRPHSEGFRRRTAGALLVTILAGLAYRAWQVYVTQLWTLVPFQIFEPLDDRSLDAAIFLARHEYFGTLVRLPPLCYGALGALVVLDPSCLRSISRRNKLANALLVFLALVNFGGCFINKFGGHPNASHILANPVILTLSFLGISGVTSPLLHAVTLVLAVTKQRGVSSTVARAFSNPCFVQLADITYDIFLTHPVVMFAMWYLLPPSAWFAPAQPSPVNFALVACLAIVLCTAAAWLHSKLWKFLLGPIMAKGRGCSSVVNVVRL